jgi:hypothetical protein
VIVKRRGLLDPFTRAGFWGHFFQRSRIQLLASQLRHSNRRKDLPLPLLRAASADILCPHWLQVGDRGAQCWAFFSLVCSVGIGDAALELRAGDLPKYQRAHSFRSAGEKSPWWRQVLRLRDR